MFTTAAAPKIFIFASAEMPATVTATNPPLRRIPPAHSFVDFSAWIPNLLIVESFPRWIPM
jgi:hypothetical protein